MERSAGIASAALRVDERILNFIVGVAHGDPRLAGIAGPIRWSVELAASHEEIARRTASAWSAGDSKLPPMVQLRGFEQGMKRAIACRGMERIIPGSCLGYFDTHLPVGVQQIVEHPLQSLLSQSSRPFQCSLNRNSRHHFFRALHLHGFRSHCIRFTLQSHIIINRDPIFQLDRRSHPSLRLLHYVPGFVW
jgi:hypothetical protein